VANLIESTACDGLLPLKVGAASLQELAPDRITSVAPFNGKHRAVGTALKAQGLGWPAPGRSLVKGDASCLWTGRGQAFLIGADPEGLTGLAALTNQTDAWARLCLEGASAEAVLARLVPVDVGKTAFPINSVARTGLGHMMAILHRTGVEQFQVMVFRSMAATAVHELGRAMSTLAARAAV
jgi:sarcosine oxidase subunit gamma